VRRGSIPTSHCGWNNATDTTPASALDLRFELIREHVGVRLSCIEFGRAALVAFTDGVTEARNDAAKSSARSG
jgi:hypothetical protein